MVSIFSLCILYFYNKTKKVFHNNSEIHTLFTHIHTLLFSFKARNKMKIENQTIASFFMYKSNTFAFIFCCHPSSNKIEKKYEKKKNIRRYHIFRQFQVHKHDREQRKVWCKGTISLQFLLLSKWK